MIAACITITIKSDKMTKSKRIHFDNDNEQTVSYFRFGLCNEWNINTTSAMTWRQSSECLCIFPFFSRFGVLFLVFFSTIFVTSTRRNAYLFIYIHSSECILRVFVEQKQQSNVSLFIHIYVFNGNENKTPQYLIWR